MEKTSKSKLFGFKSKVDTYEHPSNSKNSGLCVQEVSDLQMLPISPNAIPTSPMLTVSRINKVNQSPVGLTSPQFVVGWNDGANKNVIDMNSPVRSIPVQRRIRRCPEGFLYKIPKNKSKDDGDGAILQCIDWAKNLFESTSIDKESSIPEEKNVTESKNVANDNSFDILDDSVDEVMVLCSQAVEESIPVSRMSAPSLSNLDSFKKHSLSPKNNSSHSKRLKINCVSDNDLTKIREVKDRNESNVVSSNNFNFKHPSTIFAGKSSSSTNISTKNLTTSVVVSSKVPVQDPISSQFEDDDDELFGSFDFHSLDTLQKNHSTNVSKKSFISSDCNLAVPRRVTENSFAPKPVIKYTKEQIEQRRLEAKKRLMFNKKHKSM